MNESTERHREDAVKEEKQSVVWQFSFVILGILSSLIALGQVILQIYALRIATIYGIRSYIWFFCLDTWATIAYLGYTIRLLYLVRLKRSSDLSRWWWYISVAVLIVTPAETVWWWLREDYLLLYASVPACVIYLLFFVLVCRSLASGVKEKIKKTFSHHHHRRSSSMEMGPRSSFRLVTTV